jgi:hypothetical protein
MSRNHRKRSSRPDAPVVTFPEAIDLHRPFDALLDAICVLEGTQSNRHGTVDRSHGHFPSDKAASKLIYLVLQNIEAKWTRPPITWHQAKASMPVGAICLGGDRRSVSNISMILRSRQGMRH